VLFQKTFRPWIVGAGLLLSVASVQAAYVFAPLTDLGLSPGDTYRYAFVTSTTRDGTSQALTDYNAFVQNAADASGSVFNGSGITWKAIVSASSGQASDNIGGVFTHPIYRVDGATIATSSADFWDGSIANPISITESNGTLSDIVWTGTDSNGSFSSAVLGSGPFVRQGNSGSTSATWISDVNANASVSRHFYAISEELQVPTASVPVPPTAVLVGLGLVAAAMGRRRLRR
jgi:hypothetical protein